MTFAERERDRESDGGEQGSDEPAADPPAPATEKALDDEEETVDTVVEDPAPPGDDAPTG